MFFFHRDFIRAQRITVLNRFRTFLASGRQRFWIKVSDENAHHRNFRRMVRWLEISANLAQLAAAVAAILSLYLTLARLT